MDFCSFLATLHGNDVSMYRTAMQTLISSSEERYFLCSKDIDSGVLYAAERKLVELVFMDQVLMVVFRYILSCSYHVSGKNQLTADKAT